MMGEGRERRREEGEGMHTKRPVARAHNSPGKLSSRLRSSAFAPSATEQQALNKCERRSRRESCCGFARRMRVLERMRRAVVAARLVE
jgi:hypothetical protein